MSLGRKRIKYVLIVVAVISLVACADSSGWGRYNKLVKRELATGKRYDSLFLGIHLGMKSKEFYGYCWELNKKGILTDGNNNTAVLYKVKELKHPASMNFYPGFYDDKVIRMGASFQYDAWAPWNKAQYADSLLPEVLKMFKRWYPSGNDFITLTDEVKGRVYVKVDGNRRITIGQFNDMLVKVDYTDLLVEQKLKKEKPGKEN